jgi:hypothetical protein
MTDYRSPLDKFLNVPDEYGQGVRPYDRWNYLQARLVKALLPPGTFTGGLGRVGVPDRILRKLRGPH